VGVANAARKQEPEYLSGPLIRSVVATALCAVPDTPDRAGGYKARQNFFAKEE